MKEIIISICIFFCSIAFSMAAGTRVYGNIRPREENIEVKIVCEEDNYYGETDNDGNYEVFVEESGRCRIKIYYNKEWSDSVAVKMFGRSLRLNLKINGEKGDYWLKRW